MLRRPSILLPMIAAVLAWQSGGLPAQEPPRPAATPPGPTQGERISGVVAKVLVSGDPANVASEENFVRDCLGHLPAKEMPEEFVKGLEVFGISKVADLSELGTVLTIHAQHRGPNPPAPEKVLEFVVANMEATLRNVYQTRLEDSNKRLEQADRSAAEARSEVEQAQEKLNEVRVTFGFDTLPDAAEKQLTELIGQRISIGLELTGLQAARELILAHVDKMRKELLVGQDEQRLALKELQKIVQLREQQLDGVKRLAKERAVSEAEIVEAEIELAQARVQLATRRAEFARPTTGTGQLSRLNEKLADTQISIASATAQSESIEELIAELESVQGYAVQYERVSSELQNALEAEKAAIAEVAEERRAARRRASPKIRIIRQEASSPVEPPDPPRSSG